MVRPIVRAPEIIPPVVIPPPVVAKKPQTPHKIRLKPPPAETPEMKDLRKMLYEASVKRINRIYISLNSPDRFEHEPPGYESMISDEIVEWNQKKLNSLVNAPETAAAIRKSGLGADPNAPKNLPNTRKVSDYEHVPKKVVKERMEEMKDFIVEDDEEGQEALAMLRKAISKATKGRFTEMAGALNQQGMKWDKTLGKTLEERQIANFGKLTTAALKQPPQKNIRLKKRTPDLVMMPSKAPAMNQPASEHPEIAALFAKPMINADANGSCLYYSLYAGLTIMNYPGRPVDAAALKGQIMEWISTVDPNTPLPSGFSLAQTISYTEYGTIQNYVNHHMQNGTVWGDDIAINAFAQLYSNILIDSWTYSRKPETDEIVIGKTLTFNADNENLTYFMTLGNYGNAHFVLLTCDPVVNDPATVDRKGLVIGRRPPAEEPAAKKPAIDDELKPRKPTARRPTATPVVVDDLDMKAIAASIRKQQEDNPDLPPSPPLPKRRIALTTVQPLPPNPDEVDNIPIVQMPYNGLSFYNAFYHGLGLLGLTKDTPQSADVKNNILEHIRFNEDIITDKKERLAFIKLNQSRDTAADQTIVAVASLRWPTVNLVVYRKTSVPGHYIKLIDNNQGKYERIVLILDTSDQHFDFSSIAKS